MVKYIEQVMFIFSGNMKKWHIFPTFQPHHLERTFYIFFLLSKISSITISFRITISSLKKWSILENCRKVIMKLFYEATCMSEVLQNWSCPIYLLVFVWSGSSSLQSMDRTSCCSLSVFSISMVILVDSLSVFSVSMDTGWMVGWRYLNVLK